MAGVLGRSVLETDNTQEPGPAEGSAGESTAERY